MAFAHEESGDASFDEWVAEMGGEEAVVAMIEDTKRRVADGSLRAFQDKESFLEHFRHGGSPQA